MWCVAELDADYIAKMDDVWALYETPYNRKEPVVCLDEKPVSLHAEVRRELPVRAERHNPASITTMRRRHARTLSATLPACPWCGHHEAS